MSYDDIENATPDIVIGGTIEDPEEDLQYEHDIESDNEQQDGQVQQEEEESAKVKKSVAFAGLDDEFDEEAAKKEFEEGGGLPEQPDDVDFNELTPLSDVIINRQATINIGTIGHVAHGKSTVVRAISGVQTVRFKDELERNITIKLGYANAKIYKCDDESCPEPGCYKSFKSDKEIRPKCSRPGCNGRYKLLRHVSFVDCPGHDILMSTMLSGAAVMDLSLIHI